MVRATVLGKRKNDFQPATEVVTQKRRALRSSFNDENQGPDILCDVDNGDDQLADPFSSSKRIAQLSSPAKHSSRVAFSPAKINGHFKATKPNSQLPAKTQLVTPQTPRHRDALAKPVTPRQRVQVTAKLPLTPRTPRTPTSSTTLYNRARQLFARSAAPGLLVGRDSERSELNGFLEEGIASKSGRCLYISGPPGTGKSAFVSQICEEMKCNDNVRIGYINCMSIKNSKDLVRSLHQGISGSEEDVGSNEINDLKSTIFPTNKEAEQLYVLTLDEIDYLLTLDLEVLYTLFEWALNPASRLILIGIANALDLTDRFLPRLKSRNLRPQLLQFRPYTVSQIASVITSRLRTLTSDSVYVPFIEPAAIMYCAQKVAAQTGDLRKAFDLIRKTIDKIEDQTKAEFCSPSPCPLSENTNLASTPSRRDSCVNRSDPLAHLTPETAPRAKIPHVVQAATGAFNNGSALRLRGLNFQQKAALCALLALEKKKAATKRDLMLSTPSKSSMRTPTIRELYGMYSGLCRQEGNLMPLERNEFGDVVGGLESLGLVKGVEPKAGLKGRKEERGVVSAVSEKEVEGCLEGVVGEMLMGLLKGSD